MEEEKERKLVLSARAKALYRRLSDTISLNLDQSRDIVRAYKMHPQISASEICDADLEVIFKKMYTEASNESKVIYDSFIKWRDTHRDQDSSAIERIQILFEIRSHPIGYWRDEFKKCRQICDIASDLVEQLPADIEIEDFGSWVDERRADLSRILSGETELSKNDIQEDIRNLVASFEMINLPPDGSSSARIIVLMKVLRALAGIKEFTDVIS